MYVTCHLLLKGKTIKTQAKNKVYSFNRFSYWNSLQRSVANS